jgi:hypothetical protein
MMKVLRVAVNTAPIIGTFAISTTMLTDIKPRATTTIIHGGSIGSIGSTDLQPLALVAF